MARPKKKPSLEDEVLVNETEIASTVEEDVDDEFEDEETQEINFDDRRHSDDLDDIYDMNEEFN